MKNLTNKVAVVTGAGSGIGRAIAIDLAAAGCVLVLVDINAEGMADVVDEIAQAGGSATAHVADVSDELSDFEWVNGINAWGVIYGTKHFLPHMPSNDGHIVNIVSAAGIYAEPGRTAYAFTKFGIRGFTEALRLELAERGIGVSAIYPGIIKTNIDAATRKTNAGNPASSALKAHPPEAVATKVRAAILKNKARCALVGPETYLLDIGSRTMPTLFPRLVKWATKT